MSILTHPSTDLGFATIGLPKGLLAKLQDPQQDPALALPDYVASKDGIDEVQPDLPTIDDIEAALADHVRGGASPYSLIERLLHPFAEGTHISLDPGKGQVRLSYALSISTYGIDIKRAPTRHVAEVLHQMASRLSRFAVGDRAPEGAPLLRIVHPGWNTYPKEIAIKAASVEAARQAYRTVCGLWPASVNAPIAYSARDLVPHVLAARDLIATETLGTPIYRQQALDLIAAMQDLRTVAGVILRRNPKIHSFDRHWIDIRLDGARTIEIRDNRPERSSAHEKLDFTARHQELHDTLQQVLARHQVLRDMPASFVISIDGEQAFMDASIEDESQPKDSPMRNLRSGMFEYSAITDLAEHLACLNQASSSPCARWDLLLHGRCRSNRHWELQGPTLAHGFARAAQERSKNASMLLTDLVIDLLADGDGADQTIELHRILGA